MGASIGPCTLVCRPRELGGDGPCTQVERWGMLRARRLTAPTSSGRKPSRSSCTQVFWGLCWLCWLVMPINELKVWE